MIASLFFFLGHAFAMDAPDCYKLLNFEMERQSMGNFFAPKGEKNVPEGVMGGVQNTFEQLQASEKLFSEKRKAHEKISHVPFEKTKEGELLAIQADNLKNRFEPWDLVYLGVGGDFTQTLDYKTKQNSIRVYLLNRKVEALQTFMSVSSEIRPLPLLVEVNGDCKVTTFHYLHPSRYENRKPSKTYHSSACYLLPRIEKTAPLISMSTANSQPDELCEVGGGVMDRNGDCRCRRQRNKVILPPHESCNASEERRQGRRVLAMIESASPLSKSEKNVEEFGNYEYLQLSKACQVFERYVPKND